MSGAIDRIDKEIEALEEASEAIGQELYSSYSNYFMALGQASRQQLILATYHICTQGYPQTFLKLPLSKKQELQQGLRKLAGQIQNQLLELLKGPPNLEQEDKTTENNPNISTSVPDNSTSLVPSDNSSIQSSSLILRDPEELAEWQEFLEEGIVKLLKAFSRKINQFLQQNGILPKKMPGQLLEAVNKAEANGETIPGLPNLLNLLLEAENAAEESGMSMNAANFADATLQIMAINLRLSEIEFADATVNSWRNQIRNLSGKLNKLRREYEKKLHERAVAEAEASWRAIWFED